MKLRNKKTGEIGNFCYGYTNELCVSWQKDDGFWGKQEYNSLAELNEEWEDYEEQKAFWFVDEEGIIRDTTDEKWPEESVVAAKSIGNYFSSREKAEQAVEKLEAWKRLKDKGFRFEGYYSNYGHWHINFTFDNYCTGEPHSASDDLDLLFGGEE